MRAQINKTAHHIQYITFITQKFLIHQNRLKNSQQNIFNLFKIKNKLNQSNKTQKLNYIP